MSAGTVGARPSQVQGSGLGFSGVPLLRGCLLLASVGEVGVRRHCRRTPQPGSRERTRLLPWRSSSPGLSTGLGGRGGCPPALSAHTSAGLRQIQGSGLCFPGVRPLPRGCLLLAEVGDCRRAPQPGHFGSRVALTGVLLPLGSQRPSGLRWVSAGTVGARLSRAQGGGLGLSGAPPLLGRSAPLPWFWGEVSVCRDTCSR